MEKQQPLTSLGGRLKHWAGHLNTYTALIKEWGYSRGSIQNQVRLISGFLTWFRKSHTEIDSLDEAAVHRFLQRPQNARRTRSSGTAALYRFLRMLREQGVIPPQKQRPLSPQQRLIKNYVRYLLEERGLTRATAANNVPFADRFLSALSAKYRGSGLALAQLRAADVTEFVRQQSQKLSPGRAQLLVTALRSFFRYLLHQGKIKTDLAVCVPTVARWSFSTLPKFLPTSSVERVLARNMRPSPIGRRDYAILLLLSRLGLRACEVVALNLEDIDWENARITIRAKGGRWNQLPLPADVGEALASYLRHVRPRCSSRRMFIRDRAPQTGFAGSQSICALVRRALSTAGVESPRKGAHLFRHSLATTMIRQGSSLDEIGELLSHRSPNTTAIYAKVDLPALRPLALPWPGGVR
ncbi:MAG: tyrosine-type recombinase/integrase [Acidobacteria bacterium]|nr:tyrosine-type recombinase/integrase [Acidobacteriota bacterium]MBV9624684.1 tyrosine-type recombinase/integrase [Acidobacteriota bacterium]